MKIHTSAFAIVAVVLFTAGVRQAPSQETSLYSFAGSITGANDGAAPQAGVIIDSKGNLYGVTTAGGANSAIFGGDGTAYELSPNGTGGWIEKVLYSFGAIPTDGVDPYGGLVLDSKGNLYGTTASGGEYGEGTVFELSPTTSGPWNETILYNFGAAPLDGSGPKGTLIFDAKGNLYGTTASGGTDSDGTVFELISATTAPWTEKILYDFGAIPNDGTTPVSGLVFDPTGNLYGTTSAGGTGTEGTVFELIPATSGLWTEKILHDFFLDGTDGATPDASLLIDKAGNLYGTTHYGGSNPSFSGLGAVFELVSEPGGNWSEQILHSFSGSPDGNYPSAGLVFDADGNLYGVTSSGGNFNAPFDFYGMVFELLPTTSGPWTETDIYSFGPGLADGTGPTGTLVFDPAGNLYGTTGSGGTATDGTVYQIAAVVTATPQISLPSGPYASAVQVTITDTTENAVIYYTTNGDIPTTSSTKYTDPIEVTQSEIVTAIAIAPDHPLSAYTSASYQIGVTLAAPGFSQPGGIYDGTQEIYLSNAVQNVNFYYTTDGTTPTTSSTQYGNGISVSANETIKAIAIANGYLPSPVSSVTYIISNSTPTYPQVLYSFGATPNDGGGPVSGLVLDTQGNIYGTTKFGGPNSVTLAGKTVTAGTVFELSPSTGGGWTEKVIYNFGSYSGDGANPVAGLILDAMGNLYGTTYSGGLGVGTVFELSPGTNGAWTEKILHSFSYLGVGTDGAGPESAVLFDTQGNLYGTTNGGGSFGFGCVFELSPNTNGTWTENTLHSFSYLGQTDGYYPIGGLIFDANGNLYGTTSDGGSAADNQGGGTVFELSPAGGGVWNETILHNFGGGDETYGYEPEGSLLMNSSGYIFGTLASGGPNGFGLDGSTFGLQPQTGAGYKLYTIHSLGAYEGDGIIPYAGMTFDSMGNLWGTTIKGGGGAGAVYQITNGGGDNIVLSFSPGGATGAVPYGNLVLDSSGNLYGTTEYGGTFNSTDTGLVGGTVYEIVTTKTVQAPQISPGAGTYAPGQQVTITDATPTSVIYYTTDGTSPTLSPKKYTGPFAVESTATINAIAIAPGDFDSAVSTAQITISSTSFTATLSPSSLTFASTITGTSSTAQTVTLKNTGSVATMGIATNGITITGTGASSFLKTTTCGATLAPGASCTISVSFKPAAVGTLSATLSVNDDASGSPQTIPLSGTGVAPPVTLSVSSITFPTTTVGAISASQYVTMTNTGTAVLSITSIAVTGTNATSFVFANSCGASLAVGANCSIHGHFQPTAGGTLTAAITITDSASNSPQTIAMTGTGVEPPVTLSATSLSFASTPVGLATGSQSVTVTNTGTAALSITSIAVTGTNASSFVFANSCGTSLAVGANCSIHGHFAPVATGALKAAITITDSATSSPQTIALSGTGLPPLVTLSASSLSFGSATLGSTTASQTVVMTNTGTSTLSITSIAVTGADVSSFDFANSCGTTLAVGANCTIHGHFAPVAVGALTASITITDSATGSPQSIALSGTGTEPTGPVILSAISLTFPATTVGASSASQSVTMTNNGSTALSITSIAVTGADASSFAFANSCGTSLAVGASCAIHGHFAPTATGTLTAAITISDSAAGSPQTIALSGTGQ